MAPSQVPCDSEVHHECAKFGCSDSVNVLEILGLLTYVLVEVYSKFKRKES